VKPGRAENEEAARSRAAKKLRGNDKVGIAAQVIATAGGAGAGASVAGAAASAAGATTLLGSTTLAGWLGGLFVTTTPVGWVVGTTALGAAAGYGIARLATSGGRQDRVRRQLARRLAKRGGASLASADTDRLATLLQEKVANGAITLEKAGQVVGLVGGGRLAVEVAIERLEALPQAGPGNES
jgi:hypothetical protein